MNIFLLFEIVLSQNKWGLLFVVLLLVGGQHFGGVLVN